MASDLNKHLDRARRSLEKNKLREAVAEYQAVLEEAPANQEALQALADIYTRLNEPALRRPILWRAVRPAHRGGRRRQGLGHLHPFPSIRSRSLQTD